MDASPTLEAVVIAVYASVASVYGGTNTMANLPNCGRKTVMTFGESWLESRITSPLSCFRVGGVGGVGDQSFWWYRTRSITSNHSESASSSDGSSAASLIDRGHHAPCMKPYDRCAGFSRKPQGCKCRSPYPWGVYVFSGCSHVLASAFLALTRFFTQGFITASTYEPC